MPEGRKIEIKPAKGRPMLTWVDKRPLSHVTTFLADQVELFMPSQSEICNLQSATRNDWRAKVDCVMIDIAYDGKVYNVVLSDVPEQKTDLVQGSYELSAPTGETTVVVKIIDMLGEEVLVVK
jgi:hypothetical protein